ncbi:MAG: DUF1349 domain-containing protein [Anaerovibrio sp.]|nr:DUF1349 domain-containing protein [Anaerovibrio sp.]
MIFYIKGSMDGVKYQQMRICHMVNSKDEIQFGVYTCILEESSFKAAFTEPEVTECKRLAHSDQQPDELY